MWAVALFSAAASFPASAALHQHASPLAKDSPVRLTLSNVYDMMFTAKVFVSGEKVHPIMDTGSFELVLFEQGCMGCSGAGRRTYFNKSRAGKGFMDLGIEAQQTYGSGRAFSTAVRSGVSIDILQASKQVCWLAHDVEMDMYLEDAFGGIFGLGPPASALKFAVASLNATTDWVNSLDQSEQGQYQSALDSMRQVVKLSQEHKPWLANVGVSKFSICLLPGAGRDGVLVLNDVVPDSDNWVYVHGDFWQLDLARTSIGGTNASDCTAVMDSGTSLIGVPPDFLDSVEKIVEEFEAKYGCQDLSQWPSFELVLKDGQTLTLDPSSYAAQFLMFGQLEEQDDSSAQAATEEVRKRMPHLDRALQRQRNAGGSGGVCSAALFSMDEADGCQFLFGLPIFREYYISHKMTEDRRAGAMLFNKADSNCKLLNQTGVLAARESTGPLKVDPKKIRIPSLGLNGHRPRLSLGRGSE